MKLSRCTGNETGGKVRQHRELSPVVSEPSKDQGSRSEGGREEEGNTNRVFRGLVVNGAGDFDQRFSSRSTVSRRRRLQAFTIPEVTIASGLFTLLIAGVIYSHLFGLNLFQITRVKLGATEDARRAIYRLTDEIRSANKIKIGAGSLTSFKESTNTQSGFALQIYPTTNQNVFIRYWYAVDKNDQKNYNRVLRTTDNKTFTQLTPHAISNLNNAPIFTAEDFRGTNLVDNTDNHVIGITMQFYQLEYPYRRIGPGNKYDFYQVSAKVTRRILY